MGLLSTLAESQTENLEVFLAPLGTAQSPPYKTSRPHSAAWLRIGRFLALSIFSLCSIPRRKPRHADLEVDNDDAHSLQPKFWISG
jgi:hypothetical protein